MIRVSVRGADEYTCAACNKCGVECPGSRVFGVDSGEAIGWNGGMALAHVKYVSGWISRLEGRYQREYCPTCAKVQS